MSIASVASGSQVTVESTEHTLTTKTAAGIYILGVDLGDMVNSDVVILRIYTKMITGGTSRLAYEATYAHAQAFPNVYSIPVPVTDEIICKIEQSAGTGTFPWNLCKAG